jgi:hypothetical protein
LSSTAMLPPLPSTHASDRESCRPPLSPVSGRVAEVAELDAGDQGHHTP